MSVGTYYVVLGGEGKKERDIDERERERNRVNIAGDRKRNNYE